MSRGGGKELLIGGGVVGLGLVLALTMAAVADDVRNTEAKMENLMPARPGVYFTWAEFEVTGQSDLRAANRLPDWAKPRILALVQTVLDPLRRHLGRPIRITSGFRSQALNERIRGAPKSQHMRGEAADFKVLGMDSREVVNVIGRLRLPIDQAIWYDPGIGGHVHVSHTLDRDNRGELLHAWQKALATTPVRYTTGGYNVWSVA